MDLSEAQTRKTVLVPALAADEPDLVHVQAAAAVDTTQTTAAAAPEVQMARSEQSESGLKQLKRLL